MAKSGETTKRDDRLRRRNRLVLGSLFGLVAGMIGLTYASVPLYNLFCAVTGFGGTTQRAEQPANRVVDRKVTVRFRDMWEAAYYRARYSGELTLRIAHVGGASQ